MPTTRAPYSDPLNCDRRELAPLWFEGGTVGLTEVVLLNTQKSVGTLKAELDG
jgi:hypothetical protein